VEVARWFDEMQDLQQAERAAVAALQTCHAVAQANLATLEGHVDLSKAELDELRRERASLAQGLQQRLVQMADGQNREMMKLKLEQSQLGTER
jgi:hypothetical protein